MRYFGLCALFALWLPAMSDQAAPKDWKVVKDAKGACQISVPGEWSQFEENSGSAMLQDASNAIAVVTSQPGQTFKPLTESMLRLLHIPKDKLFENSARRIFYQDRIARDARDTNSFSAMVPGKNGACSARVVFAAGVSEETAKKIAMSVGPPPE
jgi:hypothetical protein